MSDRDEGPALLRGDTGFWDFSTSVYARPAVAETCLALQDAFGSDVNLLLYCCWLGATGRGHLETEDFARLSEAASVWQREVVMPLRAVRRRLADPPRSVAPALSEALREKVGAAELDAERIEQTVLAETLDRPSVVHEADRRRRDIGHSLAVYLAFVGAPANEDTGTAVETLVEETCAA
jgi:uncharacterized protein (TIGR02444 family)